MNNKNKFSQFYYNTIYNFFNQFDAAKILEVDFQKPWWNIIWQQKVNILISVTFFTFQMVLITVSPIIFSYFLTSNNYNLAMYFVLFWIFMSIVQIYFSYIFDLVTVRTLASVEYCAHKVFLTVDPIHHTTRSSGQILNKISKAATSFDPLFEIFTFSILNAFFSLITVVTTISFVNLRLGIITGICLATMVIFSSWTEIVRNDIFENKQIKSDDFLKSTLVENLAQNGMIRSSFATDLQLNKTELASLVLARSNFAGWNASTLNNVLRRVIFWIFSAFLITEIFELIKINKVEPLIASGILVTYFVAYNSMAHIGAQIKNFLRSKIRITDLWKFINEFGTQSFPVLETSELNFKNTTPKSSTSPLHKGYFEASSKGISAIKLHFDYSEAVKVFEDHNLSLTFDNGLYGIIGPSGTGKTTLLSILGGQLRPVEGEIKVGGVNIYEIPDSQRRRLIGLQMQTANSLKGTLRSNLVFGLVLEDYPDDKILIKTLNNVGLWSIFGDKNGLDTIIGEGGLNLSGGQRQRLNFAGLYLRNSVYHPKVLLIDEPTSSLDEISESSITNMIIEMSQSALTIVVAHRLKTLNSAAGILDVSLLEKNNEMLFMNQSELLEGSQYYRDLTAGKVELD